jgi:hypothetical protein
MTTTLEDLLAQEMTLKNSMTQLFFQMQEMHKSLAAVRIHITEIRSINRNAFTYNLPSEILSIIFEAGQPQASCPVFQRQTLNVRGKSEIPFELLISSVSHRWRDVALQTPRLWTNLQINVLQSTKAPLDLYIHRSKICLLSITFKQRTLNIHVINPDSAVKNFTWQLERLVPHVARWRDFIMDNVHVAPLSAALFPLFHLHAPALEMLAIDSSNGQENIEIFSAGAPLLSSMVLLGASIRPHQGPAIKSIQLGAHVRFSHAEFSQFVQSMPSLTHASIRADIVTDLINLPLIGLPSILSLDIDCDYSHSSIRLLTCLDLPSMETLVIRGFSLNAILTLGQHHRPYPFVQSLRITSSYHDDEHDVPIATTLGFISLFPSVQDIAFQGADAIIILAVLHDRRSTDELLWPQLSAVIVTLARGTKATWKKQMWTYIHKLVRNRLQPGHHISRIILSAEIFERGSNRQKEWLRNQVSLGLLEESITSSLYAPALFSADEWPEHFAIEGKSPYSRRI